MSYSFYSLVSSIKDKSSQAMATLSSDLKEFGSIVQEDVAEVAKTVRKTVHEQSEALRQRVEEQQQTETEDGEEEKKKAEGEEKEEENEAATEERTQVSEPAEEEKPATSLFASFTGLSLEAMGSKILKSADELLGSLGGPNDEEEEEEDDEEERAKLESARRYRLLALQEDAHTYVHPPLDVETFAKWRKALADGELLAIQEEVLAHYPTVVEKLTELVPETVSSEDFWAHYIYKASLLAAQEQRGADLLEHALNDSEEEVGWDAESPRQGSENGDSGQSFEEDAVASDAHPVVQSVDTSEPSNSVAVAAEQRPVSPFGSDADDARMSPVDSASSDGESWIELDEQRRELAQQPPLSSSSTSSFVPVDGGNSTVPPAPIAVPVQGVAEDQVLNDEEDVDWGDDVDSEPVATAEGSQEPATKKAGGADWGEWD